MGYRTDRPRSNVRALSTSKGVKSLRDERVIDGRPADEAAIAGDAAKLRLIDEDP
jgi:hypothetical protein